MRAGASSRTAQGSALLRAAHRVEPGLRAARAQAIVRSRFAEDRLRDALARGVQQYVVVSAGLDSFALRTRGTARVFEVGHPASQAAKRERISTLDPARAARVVFVPLDLETGALEPALARAGFLAEAPAFFAWLGTTYYLTVEVVERTLGALARIAAPGSELVLDYLLPDALLSPSDARRLRSAKRFARLCREPWCSAFHPLALAAASDRRGWEPIEDLSAPDQQRAYLASRSDGLRVPGWNHLLRARRADAT
jgi:methyltransferase (TIGR00027 family)